MTKILLTRHGHVEGITPERFRGRQPLALTELGRAEAEAGACGLAAGEAHDELNDTDYGRWQFKTFADAKADDPALFAAWFETPQLVRFPGGESLQDLAARVANALRFVLTRHASDTIVIVGHDSVNRALLLQRRTRLDPHRDHRGSHSAFGLEIRYRPAMDIGPARRSAICR